MSKRSIFTTITPLPRYITRDTVIETLHNHSEMIELNPLVIKHQRTKPPPNANADEFHCIWYELTDRIQYLPGGIISGNVSYKACFHDLPRGLQTHVYAPTGLDIKEHWSVGGNMPGEPREPVELGLPNVPREGLYLREDVDMRCNFLASRFVKKTLKKAHAVLVDRLVFKADILKEQTEALFAQRLAQQQQQQQQRSSIYGSSVGSVGSPRDSYLSGLGTLSPGLTTPDINSTRFSTPVLPRDLKGELPQNLQGAVHPALLRHQYPSQRSPLLAQGYKYDPGFQGPGIAEIDSTEAQLPHAKTQAGSPGYPIQGRTGDNALGGKINHGDPSPVELE
ncbi:hypothetical protein FQN53_006700 [Emmonsiellopsis sp. PD_33]|nr:hypothetical protein FQN53_006700 [Emmonsiellopsis sp. PD_33]